MLICEKELTIEMKKIAVVIEKDTEGNLIASVPELPGCYTQAKTMDELLVRMEEAIELYLETVDEEFKKNLQKNFVGIQFLEVSMG